MTIWVSVSVVAILVSACMASDYLIMSRASPGILGSAGMYKVPLDGSGQQLIQNLTHGPRAVVYDLEADILFYVENVVVDPSVSLYYTPNIRRCRIDGDNVQLLLADAGGNALAVDPNNEKLYYISDFSNDKSGDVRLYVMNYDGSDAVTIYPDPSQPAGAAIHDIALDLRNQKIYLSSNEGITVINVDGTGKEVLLEAADGYPRELALGDQAEKLYWAHARRGGPSPNGGLEVLTINTKQSVNLQVSVDLIMDVMLMNNHVYLIGRGSPAIAVYRTNLAGGDATVIPTGDGGQILTIAAPALPVADGDGGGDASVAVTSSLATILSVLLLGLLTIFHAAL